MARPKSTIKKTTTSKKAVRRGRPPLKKKATRKTPVKRKARATKKKATAKKKVSATVLMRGIRQDARNRLKAIKDELKKAKDELKAAEKREGGLLKLLAAKEKAVASYAAKWQEKAMKAISKPVKRRRRRKAK